MNPRSVALLFGILGLSQMTGDVLGIEGLRGLAAATTAAPAPRVFSSVRGLETYSSRFFIEWRTRAGVSRSLELTPDVYARLRGPYNRRNAYGAVIAYGPVLAVDPSTQTLFEAVARFALCGDAPLLRELGVDPETIDGVVQIRVEPIPTSIPNGLPLVFEAPCASDDDAPVRDARQAPR